MENVLVGAALALVSGLTGVYVGALLNRRNADRLLVRQARRDAVQAVHDAVVEISLLAKLMTRLGSASSCRPATSSGGRG